MSLSDDAQLRTLEHLAGRATYDVTPPLRLYIQNENVEIGPQTITFGAPASDSGGYYVLNDAVVLFTNMPAGTVFLWRIRDSSATPKLIWEGATVRDRVVPLGDTYEVPVGALRLELE